MKIKIVYILRIGLLTVFLGFMGSMMFFNHTHISGGNIIVHSHPYKPDRNGDPHHDHTTESYTLIQLLNNYLTNIIVVFSLASFLFFLSKEILIRSWFQRPLTNRTQSILLRGPPSQML